MIDTTIAIAQTATAAFVLQQVDPLISRKPMPPPPTRPDHRAHAHVDVPAVEGERMNGATICGTTP